MKRFPMACRNEWTKIAEERRNQKARMADSTDVFKVNNCSIESICLKLFASWDPDSERVTQI